MNENSKINFYGYDLNITKDVLIPRPETEQAVDAILNLVGVSYLPGVKPSKPQIAKNIAILDVGTGSGCIAIALAKKLPEAKIYASDISENALKVAQKNAKTLGVHPTFIISYLLDNVNFTPDLIVANLPYVDSEWDWIDKNALAKEPAIALYADDHGLKLIKELISDAAKQKAPYLVLEADPCQHKKIIAFAKDYDLYETRGFILTFRHKAKAEAARN